MPSQRNSDKRLRSKSPARKGRSRSRSRGRSKSPARTKAKQSPAPSPTRKPREMKPSSSPARAPKTPSTPTRQSARIAEIIEKDKHVPQGESRSKSLERKEMPKKHSTGKKFIINLDIVTTLKALSGVLFFSVIPFVFNAACGKDRCSLKEKPVLSRNVKDYFSPQTAAIIIGFVALQGLLSLIPVGKVSSGMTHGMTQRGKKLQYRCNGFLTVILTSAVYIALIYKKVIPVSFLYDNATRIAGTGLLVSFFFGWVLYFKARKAPASSLSVDGNTGNVPMDFLMGREVNPRIGQLDIKMILARTGILSWVLFNLSMLMAEHQKQGSISPALVFVAGSQVFYCLENMLFEENFLTTMAVRQESSGFLIVMAMFVWSFFVYPSHVRYIYEHPQNLAYWQLGLLILLNVVGYVMYRGSNWQKHQFRMDPHNPSLAHLETIPAANKKLLASGWWGLCRHPNYLGDMLIMLSWTLACGHQSAWPYLFPAFFIAMYVERAYRDNLLCKGKYGAAWDRYCQKVKYQLIPYVY